MTLVAGAKMSAPFSYRGYNACANFLRRALPQRDIAIKLNEDAVFAFPYGDGYWSKLLDRDFRYEDELEILFEDSRDVDYVLIDGGANYGYWSVLASSTPFGGHRAIAIEPSSVNYDRLANNARLNGGRFETLKSAIGARRGTARLSGTKHEAFSIAGAGSAAGEEVPVMALDDLIVDGRIPARGKYLVKLDVEGVEIEAIQGAARLIEADTVLLCEDHGSDRGHSVSRYILEQTAMKLIVLDHAAGRFEPVTDLSVLDRVKIATNVGYNVFATASAFWQDRFANLNGRISRRVH
jgi:FkbM family methyltransferase